VELGEAEHYLASKLHSNVAKCCETAEKLLEDLKAIENAPWEEAVLDADDKKILPTIADQLEQLATNLSMARIITSISKVVVERERT
jgi:hypothetical protein